MKPYVELFVCTTITPPPPSTEERTMSSYATSKQITSAILTPPTVITPGLSPGMKSRGTQESSEMNLVSSARHGMYSPKGTRCRLA